MALGSCHEPTALRVQVYTDVPWVSGRSILFLAGTGAGSSDMAEGRPLATVETGWPSSDVGDLVFLPPKGNEPTNLLLVMGVTRNAKDCTMQNPEGCIFARRRLSFVEHRTLTLPVPLKSNCLAIPCSNDTTCVQGVCVAARVDPSWCQGNLCPLPGDEVPFALNDGGVDAKVPTDGGVDGEGARDAGEGGAGTSDGGQGPAEPREEPPPTSPWTSYASPGGLSPSSIHLQDRLFTIGTTDPATIYYTLDGTLPNRTSPTTRRGPSPLLVSPSTVRGGPPVILQWFADFGAVGREATHSLEIRSIAPDHESGSLAQNLKFDRTGGPVVRVEPGARVQGTIDFAMWHSDGYGKCPGCILQWVLGVEGVGKVFCENWVPMGELVYASSPHPLKLVNFDFVAPSTPGVYVMRQKLEFENSCKDALYQGGEDVGLVYVGNSPNEGPDPN